MTAYRAGLLMLLAALLFGSGNVAQKAILLQLGPMSAVGARCLIGALIIAPFVWKEALRFRFPHRQDWPLLLGTIASFAAAATFYQASFGYTSVTNAGFIVNLCCIVTPLLAWVLLRHRPPQMVVPAVTFSIIGIFLMSGGRLDPFSRGDGYALIAACFYGLWAVWLGAYIQQRNRPFFLAFVMLLAAGLSCMALGVATEGPSLTAFGNAWRELIFLGVFSTGIAYLLQVLAQQHVSATVAMVLVSAEAVFGAFFAYLLIGETLNLISASGALLVILAIVTISIETRHQTSLTLHPAGRTTDKRPVLPIINPPATTQERVHESRSVQPVGPVWSSAAHLETNDLPPIGTAGNENGRPGYQISPAEELKRS